VESQRHADRDQTASAASSAPTIATTAAPGATLGRYRIERELGAGAIGAVYAAFDPDLERRIALKVLRQAAASDQARERLLREARAMARLAHPNVVTVYEVGTTAGRDFIAMELIHGETLADWLRAARRSPAAILDAFLAAGRGLAAAHAAGIVHRDFKPRNVLRRRDGRIAVTDFGLARDAEDGVPLALEDTLPSGTGSAPSSAPRGLTVTGALLGTPAYMAPEQWRGDAVTPGTDQFAYCVALWEALSGERPYRGPSFDDLRRQVAEGPSVLDASRIPRRLRSLLRRGLDPDPARRWPSMNAVLARLERIRRTRVITIVSALAAGVIALDVVLSAVIGSVVRPDEPAIACPPPAEDVATVWSPSIAAKLRARTSDAHVAVLDAAYRDWTIARVAACHAASEVRPAQLQCLDGVLRRFDALRRAHQRVPDAAAEEIQAQLVDPEVCREPTADRVPRLTLAPTPDVIAAFELLARSATDARPSDRELAAVAEGSTSPCARIIATLALPGPSGDASRNRALMTQALSAAEPCGDDRVRAELLIRDTRYHWRLPGVRPEYVAAVERAQNAATRVMQPELAAEITALHRAIAQLRGQWSATFQLVEAELTDYRARGLLLRQLRTVIAGAPTTALQIGAVVRGTTEFDSEVEFQTVPPSSASHTGIRISVASSARALDVVIHSAVIATLDGVSVFVVPGHVSARTMGDLSRSTTSSFREYPATPVVPGRLPGTLLDGSQPGDFTAHLQHVPLGDVTVCAISWAGDPADPALLVRLHAHFSQFAVSCKPIGPRDSSVELDAPPQRRF
jgi:predicted Ser/Thr protein kinase